MPPVVIVYTEPDIVSSDGRVNAPTDPLVIHATLDGIKEVYIANVDEPLTREVYDVELVAVGGRRPFRFVSRRVSDD